MKHPEKWKMAVLYLSVDQHYFPHPDAIHRLLESTVKNPFGKRDTCSCNGNNAWTFTEKI